VPLTILVTLDGSVWSEGILESAARVALASHAKVHLLRLFPPVQDVGRSSINIGVGGDVPSTAFAGIAPPSTDIREIESSTQAAERADSEAMDYLRPLLSRFPGLDVQCVSRESPHPADEILSIAGSLSVDLIAMATHGRSGLAHVILGSVAEAVVRAGKHPVLLYRPTEA
jgi:nucleotide-binding universal stress UspA family protein